MPATGQQPNGAMMRYALPPQPAMDARAMPGGRHKKEIKRRTKTGCLTCRKRRIKVSDAFSVVMSCQVVWCRVVVVVVVVVPAVA